MTFRRISIPIAARILMQVVLPVLAALGAGFLALNWALAGQVKSGVRETLAEVQESQGKLWKEWEIEQRNSLAAIAENASLKAGIGLYRETSGSPEAAATLNGQLQELHEGLTHELLMVLDADREPLAASLRERGAGAVPLQAPRKPFRLRAVAEVNGRMYRTLAAPINMGDENLGYVLTGRPFDATVPYGIAVLVQDGNVVAKGKLGIEAAELSRQLAGCKTNPTDCELRAGGELWIASRLGMAGFDGLDGVWVLQSVDAAIRKLTVGMRPAIWATVAGILLVAVPLSLFTSRNVAQPITSLVKRLQESEHTGVLRGGLDLTSSTSEVNELSAAFNRAAKAVADSQRRLDEAYLQFTQSMAQALDARDHYTAGHSSRVGLYALRIAQALNLPEREQAIVEVGATLHDIGKIGIPDHVLQKAGRLTDEEFRLIQQHPVLGRRILQGVAKFHDYLAIVELHHENHDGSGYPWGLQGENIPLGARIVHVVDAFDAMTTSRPYREAMPPEKALSILKTNAGSQFDPRIVQVFLDLVQSDPSILPPEPDPILNLGRAVGRESQNPS